MCTSPLKSGKDVLLKLSLYLSDKPKLLNLLSQQVDMAQHKDPRRRRYDREILSLTMTLWTRSPRNYIELLNAGFLFPSVSTHSLYKNCISKKKTGLNKDMMWWMYNTAIGAKLPACGYFGGLVLDEDEHPERYAGFKQGWPMEACWLYRLRRGVQCHEHYVQEQELIAACWPCASILVPWPDWLQDAVCLFPNKPGKFSRLVS